MGLSWWAYCVISIPLFYLPNELQTERENISNEIPNEILHFLQWRISFGKWSNFQDTRYCVQKSVQKNGNAHAGSGRRPPPACVLSGRRPLSHFSGLIFAHSTAYLENSIIFRTKFSNWRKWRILVRNFVKFSSLSVRNSFGKLKRVAKSQG